MKKYLPYVVLALFTLFLLFPVFLHFNNFLNKGNDLQEFFYPLILYSKTQFLKTGTLPLWNNMFMSGAPLLPDPQSPIFYLPNAMFLLFDVKVGFLISIYLHILAGGIGMYIFGKKILKFTDRYSILLGIIYLITPRTASFIQAGHFGLICSSAWIPYLLIFIFKLAKSPKIIYSVGFATSLAGLFYTHPTTFVFSSILSVLVFVFLTLRNIRKKIKNYLLFLTGTILNFGLIAISFLPQIIWVPETNRFLLSQDRDVYPKFISILEYLKSVLFPWSQINTIDNEKIIFAGIVSISLALVGFLTLKTNFKNKFAVVILGFILLIMSANNVSPFYEFFLSQDWYVFARVSTRIWYVIILLVIVFSIYGTIFIEYKKRALAKLVTLCMLGELLFFSWGVINKPIPRDRVVPPPDVYEYLSSDKDVFRVFCTTRCFEQGKVAEYGLQTIGGYSTLQQKNYYQAMWGAMGTYWDYYTLAVPPIGSYKFSKLSPDYVLLGEFNTKYIISPYQIESKYLSPDEKIDNFYIYKNLQFIPRIVDKTDNQNLDFEYLNPQKISINSGGEILVSEIYNKGWKATDQNGNKIEVQQRPNGLIYLNADNSKKVKLFYKPVEYIWGRFITFITLLVIAYIILKNGKNNSKS